MKAGGIKPVSIFSPWSSVAGFQQDIWVYKVGPFINVSLKSIVLMYLVSLGVNLWSSALTMLPGTLPIALSIDHLTWLASTCPQVILYTQDLDGGKLCLYFHSLFTQKDCTTLTERGGTPLSCAEAGWVEGEWAKAQRRDSWVPVANEGKGHFWLLPSLSSHFSLGFLPALWRDLDCSWSSPAGWVFGGRMALSSLPFIVTG